MAIDQEHEKNNATVKGDGGAAGLMQNQDSICRWTVAGPEVSCLIDEFENAMEFSSKGVSENRHHQQAKSVHLKFKKHAS